MTRLPHLRAGLISATLVVLVVAAWLLVAPTQIGGETSYVTTSGISMSPRFHSGDLGVVRPAADYRVGDIVAYRSTTLRIVVLHRIIAVKGGRFVTKGDNNDFVDPDHPARADVVGKLAFRVPHGGRVLAWLHTPFMAALLCGGMGLLLFMGAKQRRRRRDRRRPLDERGIRQLEPLRTGRDAPLALRHPRESIFTTCAVVASSASPSARSPSRARRPSLGRQDALHREGQLRLPRQGLGRAGVPRRRREHRRPDLRQARARRPPQGSLPPGGQGAAPARRHHGGRAGLSSPTGWSRTIQLAAPKRFTGDYAAADVTLDVQRLRSLIRNVEKLTGSSAGAAYTVEVTPACTWPGRSAASRHQRLRAGAEAQARSAEAASRHGLVLRRRRRSAADELTAAFNPEARRLASRPRPRGPTR